MQQPWHLYLMIGMYVFAGLMHFLKPRVYVKVMPPTLPYPKTLVYLSGAAEIILGLALLYTPLRPWALWGIVLMLLLFLPVHFYMLKARIGMPLWLLWLRIPLQFLLIWWALYYLPNGYL